MNTPAMQEITGNFSDACRQSGSGFCSREYTLNTILFLRRQRSGHIVSIIFPSVAGGFPVRIVSDASSV